MASTPSNSSFYWQTARDSLLTPAALTMFQIACKFNGQDFDTAKLEIDRQYEILVSRDESQRHGGNFQTFIRVFEESGWMTIHENQIVITDAGKQAEILLCKVPDFLKAIPYFLIDLLAKYQLNNPSGPDHPRNQSELEAIRSSNIFPYWTIWKIMRDCENKITTEELKRFVFRLHRSEDIPDAIVQIRSFRRDTESGTTDETLNQTYPAPLTGAVGEPKYIMARAGTQIGKQPSLINKPDRSTYELDSAYLPLIDDVLTNEPIFKDYLDNNTWTRDYGKPIALEPFIIPFSDINHELEEPLSFKEIPDTDPIFKQVEDLIKLGTRNILFSGPPGTSKTTYALGIGAKLVENQQYRFHNIQFHQSFGYEDFVEGYVPSRKESGPQFELKNKIFLDACWSAKNDPDKFHVLIIDELNRGDPSRIFGEALTYIERRNEIFELSSGKKVMVPSNLIVIATMNPLDRSIADLDMAMERRFDKVFFMPDSRLLKEMLDINNMETSMQNKLIGFFEYLIKEIDNKVGQAYFKDAKDLESIKKSWEHKVLPFLEKELRHSPEKIDKVKQQFDIIFTVTQAES